MEMETTFVTFCLLPWKLKKKKIKYPKMIDRIGYEYIMISQMFLVQGICSRKVKFTISSYNVCHRHRGIILKLQKHLWLCVSSFNVSLLTLKRLRKEKCIKAGNKGLSYIKASFWNFADFANTLTKNYFIHIIPKNVVYLVIKFIDTCTFNACLNFLAKIMLFDHFVASWMT